MAKSIDTRRTPIIRLKEITTSPEFIAMQNAITQIENSVREGVVQWFYNSTMGSDETDTLPLPTKNISIRVMDAVADVPYTNLKIANGTAAGDFSFTTEDVKSPFLYFNYDTETDTWVKKISQIDLSDYSKKEDLDQFINGDYVSSGVTDDLSTYTSLNGSSLIRLNNIHLQFGKIKRVRLNIGTAGSFKLAIFQRNGNNAVVTKLVSLVASIGINQYLDGIDFTDIVIPDQGIFYAGVVLPDGGARIFSKSKTAGSYTNGSINAVEGDSFPLTQSAAEIAVQVDTQLSNGIKQQVDGLAETVSTFDQDIQQSVKKNEVVGEESTNVAKSIYRVNDAYINSSGSITTGTGAVGWQYIKIPVKAGEQKTVHNFSTSWPSYWGFFNTNMSPISGTANRGTITAASLPFVSQPAPQDGFFAFNTKRATNSPEQSAQLVVNNGTEALPYEDPEFSRLVSVSGYDVPQGGNSNVGSFEDLNDVPEYEGNEGKALRIKEDGTGVEAYVPENQAGGDASFNSIYAAAINTSSLSVNNIPIWDETGAPPISIGSLYKLVDANGNFQIKERGV